MCLFTRFIKEITKEGEELGERGKAVVRVKSSAGCGGGRGIGSPCGVDDADAGEVALLDVGGSIPYIDEFLRGELPALHKFCKVLCFAVVGGGAVKVGFEKALHAKAAECRKGGVRFFACEERQA